MSFPRYPKYKSSGVEWLGEVPDGWSIQPLKRVVNPARQITYGIVQAGPHVPDGVPYIRPADMMAEDGIKAPEEIMRTSEEIAANYKRSTIRSGDIVCSIGPSFGKLMITPEWLDGANLTQGTARIAVKKEHNAKYYFWTLRASSSVGQWVSSVGGATFSALNLGPLAKTTILVPPLPEQTAIAEFLDRETRKIDELVAEQRRLIELLKEKRQAVISHAVTKGLNPHAPMKPSGIEWLGDVPEHWEVTRLGFLCSKIGSGKTPLGGGEAYLTEGILFIRSQNVYDDGLYLDDVVYVSDATDAEQSWSRVLSGDILLNITGASLGRTCLVPDDFQAANVNQHVCILRLSSLAFRHFVSMVLKSSGMKSQFDAAQNGAAREGLNFAQISKLALALPPEGEQASIIKFLDTKLAKFDTLTAEAQRAIDLLQERRTALISAAVTGQIDVRPQTQN